MIKKIFVILLLIQVLFLRTLPLAMAQTVPTDTPTPTPTVDPNTVTPTPDPTTVTPTIDPNTNPTVTPTPTVDITATNSGTVNNNSQSTAISGDNAVLSASTSADPQATPPADAAVTPTDTPNQNTNNDPNNPTNAPNTSATPTPDQGNGNTIINTGNAVAVTNTDNSINTNSINSQFVNQTINIFVTQNGNLDLSVPLNIVSQLITQQNNVSPQINIQMNVDNSYAVVSNTIVNSANSGDNSATGSGQLIINTGNAYSVVALTNKVNFTIVDSVVHVITINIFGTLNGNIILPDLSHSTVCQGCGLSASIVNTATVDNNVSSTAVSGQNTATIPASGSATITTGNAVSVVNIDNIVNTNVIGMPFEHLFINAFGLWNGSFLGWGGFAPQVGGRSYAFNGIFPNGANTDCPNCSNNIAIQNTATVTNNVVSSANTGGNSTTGGDSSIKTGNAYSAVQLLNFVNANFIRTFGFFGFINIFGHFNGSIGNAEAFVTPTPSPEPTVLAAATTTDPVACTTTGDPAIATKLSDNVGLYVNPGDTVLFYVRIKNTGPNDLQSEKVKLVLSTNGKQIGGTIVNIKKAIQQGKSELVTLSLSLSTKVPGGLYTATATTEGITCDNKTAFSTDTTTFHVSGLGALATTNETQPTPSTVGTVLGTHTATAAAHTNNWLTYVLLLVVIAYLIIRGIRSRHMLAKLVKDQMTIKERLSILRLLLL